MNDSLAFVDNFVHFFVILRLNCAIQIQVHEVVPGSDLDMHHYSLARTEEHVFDIVPQSHW